MSKRFITRWIWGLLVALLFLVLPVSAVSNTVLKTSVPNSIVLSIEITGKGSVWIGNRKCSDSQSVSIPRNEQMAISIRPATGYLLSSVKLNGNDIGQQLNNGFVIDAPEQDMTLSVVFLRKSAIWLGMNPPTGDDQIRVLFWMFIFSLASLLLLPLTKKLKK